MKLTFPLAIKITIDERSKDAPFIAYAPELDIASCGKTEKKARQNLIEAISITLDEIDKKGKLEEFLQEIGFYRTKRGFRPPRMTFESFSYQASS